MRDDLDMRKVVVTCMTFGLFIGLIGSVPGIWIPNLCCLWIIAGGFLSAMICGWDKHRLELADSTLIGMIFGLSYSLFNEVGYHLVNGVFALFGFGLVAEKTELAVAIFLAFGYFFFNIILSTFFGAVGGLIYASIFFHGGDPKPDVAPQRKSRLG